jgi:hypothetical protein
MKEQETIFTQAQMIEFAQWSVSRSVCGLINEVDFKIWMKENEHKEQSRSMVKSALKEFDVCLYGFDEWFEGKFYPKFKKV